jgi:hypothetical protein
MSVRKRKWITRKGEVKEAWIADYTDQAGQRTIKTFGLKKKAEAFLTTAKHEVKEGIHTYAAWSVSQASHFLGAERYGVGRAGRMIRLLTARGPHR